MLLLINVLFFSFIISFGVFDPVFGVRPGFGLVDFSAASLVLIIFIYYHRVLVEKIDKSVVYLALLVVALFVSSSFYGYSDNGRYVFNFKLFVMVLLYSSLLVHFKKNPRHIHYSLLSYSFGVVSLIIILNTALSSEMLFNKGRLWIFGENPNSTSARFSLAAIYLVYISIYNPLKWPLIRSFSFILSLPIMYTVLQSGSRGSVISLVFSLIILLYFSHMKKVYKILLTLVLMAVAPKVLDVFINSGSIADRLSETFNEGGLGAREEIWLHALDIFYNNPIFGVGEAGYFNEMKKIAGRAVDAHNLIIYLLASGGVISFFLFSLFYRKLLVNSVVIFKSHDALPFLLLLNVTLVSLKTGGALTYSIMWFVFSIVSAYPRREVPPPKAAQTIVQRSGGQYEHRTHG
ncbi:O-antigen ligase family protein [uncultured Halomonas sp.]|uniref:O-antigen ligase family protein n=1 Tax=uncultured Halomonas sp. TaxID=173971 RepID=UPI002637A5BA|nr:O-antigen ligase family protein [uncultured Halomonas sp.]